MLMNHRRHIIGDDMSAWRIDDGHCHHPLSIPAGRGVWSAAAPAISGLGSCCGETNQFVVCHFVGVAMLPQYIRDAVAGDDPGSLPLTEEGQY